MWLALGAVIAGLVVLVWSADRFVDGASATARHAGMPTLLVGMLVIGFGTSAPEMVVSALASVDGNPGLALGNAYGSNITNIALILGLVALLSPISVHSSVLRRELPVLAVIMLLAGYQLYDGQVSHLDAVVLLAVFFMLMGWSVYQGMTGKGDPIVGDVDAAAEEPMPLGRAIFWLVFGLVLLVASSRLLVWGAVSIAEGLGVSDLVIGLTVV
ncbi:MAG TPA: calcium/sodium antiporter, partial [Alcanivorax sp.]|nr:calcium/sodium antiporter [Alcanivorax sp.]